MPDSSKVSGSFYLCALVGVIIRWVIMGKRAGFGLMSAVNNGVTSTFLIVIFIQCANEMSRLLCEAITMAWSRPCQKSFRLELICRQGILDGPLEHGLDLCN